MTANYATAESEISYPGWRVAAAAALGMFVSFASVLVYTFGVFLKPVSTEFGWSRQAVSAAFSVAAVAFALCAPLLGRQLDTLGPRRVMVPCIAVFGCGLASLSLLTRNIWHLYAVFLLLGMVGNGTSQMAYARAVSMWFEQHRGVALGIVMAGGASGAILLPPFAEWLIARAGWRAAFSALGGMVVLAGLPIAAVFVRERHNGGQRAAGTLPGATVRQGLRSRVFWLVVTMLFSASMMQNVAITHLPALLNDRGVRPDRAALTLSAMGVASLAGRLIGGYLLDRIFAPYISAALLVLAAAGAFVLSTATTFAFGCVAAILIGAGMGGEADVVPYLLSRYLGLRSFSTLYGFGWTAYAVAAAAGPAAMGFVYDLGGTYEGFLAVLAVCTLGAAGLNFAMPRYSSAVTIAPGI